MVFVATRASNEFCTWGQLSSLAQFHGVSTAGRRRRPATVASAPVVARVFGRRGDPPGRHRSTQGSTERCVSLHGEGRLKDLEGCCKA